MVMRRNDIEDKLHFRSDRIACENGMFYFTSREGVREGPYTSREQAEVAVAVYIRDHLDPTSEESRLNASDPHVYRHTKRSSVDRRDDERRNGERRQH